MAALVRERDRGKILLSSSGVQRMSKAVLYTHCSHLVLEGSSFKDGDILEAIVSHGYCKSCAEYYEKMMAETQLELFGFMNDLVGGVNESNN